MWKDFDPFLHITEHEAVDETENFFVIPARAPYVKNHLLIIPKKKVYLLKELSSEEQIEMFDLLEQWDVKLHEHHDDVNLLLRDGLVWWVTEKSVNHLHFHLIPDCPIWAESLSDINRKFYEDGEYIELATKIKNKFLKDLI